MIYEKTHYYLYYQVLENILLYYLLPRPRHRTRDWTQRRRWWWWAGREGSRGEDRKHWGWAQRRRWWWWAGRKGRGGMIYENTHYYLYYQNLVNLLSYYLLPSHPPFPYNVYNYYMVYFSYISCYIILIY